jgi:hypothetical protein
MRAACAASGYRCRGIATAAVRSPYHPGAREQFPEILPVTGGALRLAIGGHKCLECVIAVSALILEEWHDQSLARNCPAVMRPCAVRGAPELPATPL